MFCVYSFQDNYAPGMMYFLIAGLTALCVVSMFFLPETKNAKLIDTLIIGSGREKEGKQNEEDSKLV